MLELLVKLQGELGISLVLITHDLGVVADLADEVMVMYSGQPVEQADRRTAYYEAHHPYTRGLLESIPVAGDTGRLRPIPGQPPSMLEEPPGCAFRPRCRFALDRCATDAPPLRAIGDIPGHRSACWLPDDVAGQVARRIPVAGRRRAAAPAAPAGAPLLELTDIVKYFPVRSCVAAVPRAPGRARRRRGQPADRRRRDARPGRRDRLRQVHAGPQHRPAAAGHQRAGHLRRP